MKIIREGNAEPETVRFECRNCKCIFEALKRLEVRLISDQRDGDYYECECPTCKTNCTVQFRPSSKRQGGL